VMDAADGHLTWLDTPDWDVEAMTLSTDGRIAVWSVNVDGASQLRARNLETGVDAKIPVLPLGRVRVLCVPDDGRTVAMLFSTPTRAANAVVMDVAGGDTRWLADADPDGADRTRFVEPELVHYTSFDGARIPAYLYRPRCSPTQLMGVLIEIHGGPASQERPIYGSGFYQFMASLGIAVLAPNIRGSVGYGRPYQNMVYRDWGGGDLADIAAAVRHLRAQDWVDPNRIGLRGGSYGGFMVLSCIARLPELNWAAAVAMFGPTNLVTLARATPPAYRALVAEMIGDPDDDVDFLLDRSPVTHAAQIRTPLFVLQGANDPRVPQSESDQLVALLRELGIEVRYDVYPDEGHGFAKSSNQIKADSDAAHFLASHLAIPTDLP
jgi:dipeptidyl aminopeptidase/acylaminoacyl peptidase